MDCEKASSLIEDAIALLSKQRELLVANQKGHQAEIDVIESEAALSDSSRSRLMVFMSDDLKEESKVIETITDAMISLSKVDLDLNGATRAAACTRRVIELVLKDIRKLNLPALQGVVSNIEVACNLLP